MLVSVVTSLGSVVESSKGGDSQAHQLELLHDIEQQVRLGQGTTVEQIKAVQADLEKHLMASLLQGPAPPLRHLISSIFVYAYGRGARQGMYTTVGQLLSWMTNKGSPAKSESSKAAILWLLGDLSRSHGGAMVALCHDTIGLLIKMIRAPEIPLRTAACMALASALVGSGGIPAAMQQEMIKNLKQTIGERGVSVELRQACLACCAPLVGYSEGLWATDIVDQVCTAPVALLPA